MAGFAQESPLTVSGMVSDYVRQTLDEVTSLARSMGDYAATQAGLIGEPSPASSSTAPAASRRTPAAAQLNNNKKRQHNNNNNEDEEESAYLAEVDACRLRASRLRRIVTCLHQWEQQQQQRHRDAAQKPPPASHEVSVTDANTDESVAARAGGRSHSAAVRRAVAALGACSRQLGMPGVKTQSGAAAALRPPGVPVSFPEATLRLYSHNVKIVFRRPKPTLPSTAGTPHKVASSAGQKRDRPGDEEDNNDVADRAPHLTSVQMLSTAQKKPRWQLYTCRDALLPLVDQLVSSPTVQGPPLSPALRHFNQLNKSAEAAMLRGAWQTTTKAQLLRELPRLHDEVTTTLHDGLRKAFFRDTPNMGLEANTDKAMATPALPSFTPPVYFRVAACNEGVVRLVVQEALYADLTYDLARGVWSVCRLHWNIWTTPSGATLMNAPRASGSDADGGHGQPLALVVAHHHRHDDAADSTADEASAYAAPRFVVPPERAVFVDSLLSVRLATSDSSGQNSSTGSDVPVSVTTASSPALRALLLHHTEDMHLFLQKQFREQGFTAGCLALNQLVCAVVMDVLVRQLTALRADFFVGPLQSAFSLDIRAGTFVAFHLLTPPVVAPGACTSPAPLLKPVHVRCDLAGGTVLVDQVWGTDVAHRRRSLLLHPSGPSGAPLNGSPERHIVVDAEALLWGSYSQRAFVE